MQTAYAFQGAAISAALIQRVRVKQYGVPVKEEQQNQKHRAA